MSSGPELLDQAYEKLRAAFVPAEAAFWEPQLRAVARLLNGERIPRKVVHAGDTEEVRDILAEARFALALVGFGFGVDVEPLGKAGPDLGIALGERHLLIEVTRLRLQREMPVFDFSDPTPMLADLGDPLPDVRRAYDKIRGKISQLNRRPGAIAVWNDDEVLDDLHCRTAIHWVERDLEAGLAASAEHLELVLYLSSWVSCTDCADLSAWTVQPLPAPWVRAWQERLDREDSRRALQAAVQKLGDFEQALGPA